MQIFKSIKKDSCPCCDSDQDRYLGMRGGKFQREGLGIESKIVQCLNCSLVYPNPFPMPESLESLYGDTEDYFSNKGNWDMRSKSYENLVNEFVERVGNKNKNIELLDIGAGRGEFNKAALSFPQVNCMGIEVSEGSIKYARERGIELKNTPLQELIDEGKTFDGICLNAVLAHVHEPGVFMSEISLLLKKGGHIYVDTANEPNLLTIIGNFFNKLAGKKGIYNLNPTWQPYCVYGFNPKALQMLFNKHDIEIGDTLIYGAPVIPLISSGAASSGLKDRIMAMVGILIQRFANAISLGTHMYVWGKKL